MIDFKIVPIETEKHIDILNEINSSILSGSERDRVKSDFKKGYFKGFLAEDTNQIALSYVLLSDGYSTWQSRVLFVVDFWFSISLEGADELKLRILTAFKDTLFKYCRQYDYKRINWNLKINDENKLLSEWLLSKETKGLDLTVKEDWSTFEMPYEPMIDFVNRDFKYDSSQYKILKVQDMNKYAQGIRDIIYKLAEFEKMADQVETKVEDLIRDYEHEENISFDGTKSKNRFYETIIVLKENFDDQTKSTTHELIGYSIYFFIYDLKRGRGCYMEDLFILEKFRKIGLGCALWSKVVKDSIENFNTKYVQWTVLNWNKSAIEFYQKFNSVDVTERDRLHFLRLPTESIYNIN